MITWIQVVKKHPDKYTFKLVVLVVAALHHVC